MSKARKQRLLGPVIAVRTFRTDDGKLDLEKQQRHLKWMIDQGITGFINGHGNVAPRLVLHIWDLWQNKRYDEYDQLVLRMYVDPVLRMHMPEELRWRGMGEGLLARLEMETAGLKMGPSFPAQQPLGEEFARDLREGFAKSGLADWVDWKE